MADHNNKIVRISVGKPTNLGKSQNVAVGWQKFLNKWFKSPTRTGESMRDYEKSAFNEKNRLKGAGGWMLMAPLEGKSRKAEFVQERQIVSLDFDNIPSELFDEIMVHKTHWLNEYEFLGHTTRSDREDSRRLRILLLGEQDIPVENYEALTRILAYEIDPDMEVVDPVSFRVAQMMYLPTVSKDQKYTVVRNQGKLLDMWQWLDGWKYDWKNKATLPRSEREDVKLREAMQAEDPHEKRGIIGAFCRAYGIEDIISEFLPEVYGDQDPHSTLPRYTYLGGHSQYGAVVYDDKFLFSWHGTDPACEKLCNSWDLYRIHKFGKKDAEFGDDEIDIRDLPSQKAMLEFSKRLPKVNAELAAEKIDLEAMLEDLGDDDEQVAAQVEEIDPFEKLDDDQRDILGLPPKVTDPRKAGLPDYKGKSKAIARNKKWTSSLEATLSGEIKCTVANLVIILTHDPRFRGLMAINAFTGEMVATRTFKCQMAEIRPIPLRDPKNGDLWSKAHDSAIVALLSAPNGQGNYGYGMDVGDGKLEKALWLAAQQFVFHPVIDHILALPEWDGTPRLDRMWIDYMGTADTAYHRETARFTVVGAIARLFHPGLAFDYVPILISKQDRRKSTWVQHLGFGWWGGELTADFHNLQLAAEQMQGKLFLEMAEITNMKRSDAQQQKAFISRTKDKVRLAYDRRAIEFHRQNLFIGTTNEYQFLQDDQNRRFWPIKMHVEFIDTDRFLANRDQIWAEALVRYKEMFAAAGSSDRVFFRLSKKAKAEAEALQDSVRVDSGDDGEIAQIEDFLETQVPLSQVLDPKGVGAEFENEDGEPTVLRVVTCAKQLVEQALGEDLPANANARSSRTRVVGMRMSKVDGWERYSDWKARHDGGNAKVLLIPGYGRETAYVRKDAVHEEILQGYRAFLPRVRPKVEDDVEDLL